MAKATTTDIDQRGWHPESFGAPADWGDYVTDLVDRAGRWAAAKIGAAAYAAATADTYATDLLVRAECCWCEQQLWTRRAAYQDASASVDLTSGAVALQRQYLANASAAHACATQLLDEAADALGVARPSDSTVAPFAVGHVETGRYPQASTAALNYGGVQ